MTHLSWDEVYARQMKRAPLVGEWMDSLQLKAGDQVLEIGAGPGYVSLVLADRVGAGGGVYAVDRSPEALAHLERLQKERGISHIHRLVADAATLEPAGLPVGSALITMVLHHAEDPAGILDNVARLLLPGALVVVAEFHPEGPGDGPGPPQAHRLRPEQVQAWGKGAGFLVRSFHRQTPEHYMVLFQLDV
ncbi:MAG: methyltransferase domain-containing protein [Proteobacteria bacterium]|nr:methyltransferase domain-containing protein [Pseudomonadota bacterium]